MKAWTAPLTFLVLITQLFVPKISAQVITEAMASNGSTVADGNSQYSDWIEIYNNTANAIDLTNFKLIRTKNDTTTTDWRFPSGTTIAANSYGIVFASENNATDPAGFLHTNFKIAAEGARITLNNDPVGNPGDGTVVSTLDFLNIAQTTDVSYGPDGVTTGFMCPTPGAANTAASASVPGSCPGVATPTLSQPRGFYSQTISVTISSSTPGASLIYTLDGSAPIPSNANAVRVDPANEQSTASDSVNITTTTIVRAGAVRGFLTAQATANTYLFVADVANQPDARYSLPAAWNSAQAYSPAGGINYGIDSQATSPSPTENGFGFTDALVAIPTLSISSDQAGLLGTAASEANAIYARPLETENGELERPATAELLYPNGSAGFQINCGLKMHGGFSRNHTVTPKHSFDLLFKSQFGPTVLDFPLFPDTSVHLFNRLILRACATDSWPVINGDPYAGDPNRWLRAQATYTRDQWMRDSQLAMGHLSPHGTYVHLYLNGLYWGIYNISERVEDAFVASYLGGNAADYDIIDVAEGSNAIVTRGDNSDLAEWNAMMGATGVGSGDNAGYLRLRGWSSATIQSDGSVTGVRNTSLPVYLNMDNFIDYMILHIHSRADDWPNHNWFAVRKEDTGGQFNSDGFRFIEWDQELSNMSLFDNHISWSPFSTFENVAGVGPAALYDLLRRNSSYFQASFKQRMLALMSGTGALTPVANHQRWLRRINELDRAIVGESARWGDEREQTPASGEVFPFTRMQWLENTDYMLNQYWHENLKATCDRFSGLTPSLLPDPFITRVPKSQTVQEGSTATFTSEAYGTTPTYQWFFNGVAISGATSASYSIANVTPQHAGYYSVRVQNSNGTRTSDSAVLTVVNREEIWLEDAAPTGATTLAAQGGDSWDNWVTESVLAPFSGTKSLQSANYSGFHQMYYVGVTPSSVSSGDILFVYVYLDPENPPQEIMLQWYTDDDQTWWHRAYWGGTQIQNLYPYVTGTYMGPLPAAERWVRLEVPASAVNLVGRQVSGMALTLYGGRVNWDRAGKRSGGDLLWIDDALPGGPYVFVTGSFENWRWVADAPRPISGKLAVQSENLSGLHQVYFAGANDNWYIDSADSLFAYVFINSGVEEVMLQWVDAEGTWTRAFWGSDRIAVSKTYMGPLPAVGTWVRLEVPATTLELQGKVIQGMALSLYGGQATWDRIGKIRN